MQSAGAPPQPPAPTTRWTRATVATPARGTGRSCAGGDGGTASTITREVGRPYSTHQNSAN